jgi:hypothetical protein
MSRPTPLNIDLYRGDDYSWEFRFTSAGTVQDITGWTIYFTVKRYITDADEDAIIQKIITTHTDPTNGISQVSLSHSETILFPVGSWLYDVQIKTVAGEIYTLFKGSFKVIQDVTLTY